MRKGVFVVGLALLLGVPAARADEPAAGGRNGLIQGLDPDAKRGNAPLTPTQNAPTPTPTSKEPTRPAIANQALGEGPGEVQAPPAPPRRGRDPVADAA